jgi:hypothetical protein
MSIVLMLLIIVVISFLVIFNSLGSEIVGAHEVRANVPRHALNVSHTALNKPFGGDFDLEFSVLLGSEVLLVQLLDSLLELSSLGSL